MLDPAVERRASAAALSMRRRGRLHALLGRFLRFKEAADRLNKRWSIL